MLKLFLYLQDLGDSPAVLNDAELNEEAGKAIFIILLAWLGVIPGELLKLQTKQNNLKKQTLIARCYRLEKT